MRKLNIAIIGCGKHFENFHLPSFLRLKKKINICGIFDVSNKRTRYISKKYKIKKIYNDLSELLNDNSIDIVDICSPPVFHYNQIINCINFKKNIMVEKPFVLKLSQINCIINLIKKNKIKIMCLQHSRFRIETKKIFNFIETNRKKFGKVYLIKALANYHKGIPKQSNNSFTDLNFSGGGPLLDHGSHLLDLVFFLFDFNKFEIKSSVFFKDFLKKNKNIVYNVEEMAIVNAIFDKKIFFNFETSYLSHYQKDEFCLSFYFENGYLNWPSLEYNLRGKKGKINIKETKKASDIQFSHFVDCVIYNRSPLIDLNETKKVVEIIEKFYNKGLYIKN